MFSTKNKKQIEDQGLTIEMASNQITQFKHGFPQIDLSGPATPTHGIRILYEEDQLRYISVFENSLASGLKTMKFVPASGAASRMFKKLFEFLDNEIDGEDEFMKFFFENIEKFAFYNELVAGAASNNKKELVSYLLSEKGMAYGIKPKGQLAFHKYKSGYRTPFEEHLVEAASYCTGSDGIAKVHFTVSENHKEGFEEILKRLLSDYQKRYGIKLDVSFSFQQKNTDTIAVKMDDTPATDNDGNLIFRPGGHGALIQNLNNLDADLIFIKNIDNVVPDHLKHQTKHYKKALAGLLVSIRNQVFSFIEKLNTREETDTRLLEKAEMFVKKDLCIDFDISALSPEEKHKFLLNKLNRPIRICGMVRNQGEPGGGPFWAKNSDGTSSLQIIEKAQIDLKNEEQLKYLQESTHFNPVDLICSTKNYKGQKFDLNNFIDYQTGFISIKSKDGKEMKALELPGLWNGAMSDWNTIFIEVPIETFNPVKTINDLLRPEHL